MDYILCPFGDGCLKSQNSHQGFSGFTTKDAYHEMCDSRKYPYPPTDGQWKFLGGGGVKM